MRTSGSVATAGLSWMLTLLLTAAPALAGTSSPFADDPYPSTYQPQPRQDTLIVGATILTGGGERIDQGEVLLRDGRIAAVGHGLERAGAVLVDAAGRWLTPGIIDVHSHNGTHAQPLTSADSAASDVSETSGPNSAHTWIEHAVNPQDPTFAAALRSGVTALQVMPGSAPLFGGRSVVLKPIFSADVPSMKFPDAPQGLKMSCGENAKRYFGGKGLAPDSRQGGVALVRDAFLQAQAYRDAWRAHERGRGRPAPQRDLGLDTLAAVLDGSIAVHMHCYRASDMVAMLGVASEFGFRIGTFHHASEAYKMVPQLRQAGSCVAVWSDWWGFKMEILDAIRENASMVEAGGGCVMMHSDSGMVGQRLAIEAAKANAAGARVGLGLPPERLIRWVTSTPASALGLDDRIGTIAPGFNADLVLWSHDPFSIYARADLVYVDGALVHDRSDPGRTPASDFELGRPQAPQVRP